MSMGRFVVVGTPIGNLDDISSRAVKALAAADVVYCEDTRRARKLFSALSITAPRLVRLDRHNETDIVGAVLGSLQSGATAVLTTDAGMPGISDPGDRIVKAVAEAGYAPEVVPGPSAVTAALALSGLPASQYRFAGFLPRKGRERSVLLEELAATTVTVVLYEAPGRVGRTVADLATACGPDRPFVAARELTKLHEDVWRGTLGEAQAWLSASELRGEWVLMVGGLHARRTIPFSEGSVAEALEAKLAAGADRKAAVAEVAAELSVPKRQVYDIALGMKGGG
jgi:16S rRNA (cytidine1402-2'-O)-methyltransferase